MKLKKRLLIVKSLTLALVLMLVVVLAAPVAHASPEMTLLPTFDTNPAGTSHTVAAVYGIGGVPQVGVPIDFQVVSGPNAGKSGSDTTDANGEATFTYTDGGSKGIDTIRATVRGAPHVWAQAKKVWATLTWEGIELLPTLDINPAGTSHTVAAVYGIGGVPQVGVPIDFQVVSGPNAGKSGSDTTDANGEATFTYTGDGGEGTDIIQATTPVDPLIFATAKKVWATPELLPAFDTNPAGTSHTVTFVYKIAGVPQVGEQITFWVLNGPNVGQGGTDTTDANGEATFTYTSNGKAGTDTIEAIFLPGGISMLATKVWSPPVEVGGEVYPVNKLAVLVPWVVLVVALLVGTAVVVRRRRAQG